MRPSERRLVIIFCAMLIFVAGLIGSQQLLSWQRALKSGEDKADLARMESEILMAQSADWNARADWINQTQPTLKDALEANQELSRAEDLARERGLETINKQLLEPEKTDVFQQIGFTMTVKGQLPEVFRWLHRMQSPADFRVIPSLKVAPDKQDANLVVATVQFWRWYQPPAPVTAGGPP
ncbi:MAG: GspMb/PilO family protein [Verrucomicrobium sp.]